MAQQTRLGVSGFARPPYGSFAGKAEAAVEAGSILTGTVSIVPAVSAQAEIRPAVTATPSVEAP